MSDDRAQTIARLAEAAARAVSPHLYDGTFEAKLASTCGLLFSAEQAAATTGEMRSARETRVRPVIDAMYDEISAIALREAADDYRTTLRLLRANGTTIEQGPAEWMEDRAIDLERKQARRG